jgi:hypothetical protein
MRTLLREIRRRCATSITQQHTIIALTEAVLIRSTNALIGVHTRKEQCTNTLLLQELFTHRRSTPHATHSIFV